MLDLVLYLEFGWGRRIKKCNVVLKSTFDLEPLDGKLERLKSDTKC
jgi:hypothetical protein